MCLPTGIEDEIAITDPQATSPLLTLPITIWEIIYSFLPTSDASSLSESYPRMKYIRDNFCSASSTAELPAANRNLSTEELKTILFEANGQYRMKSRKLNWDAAWKNYLCPPRSVCQPEGLSVKLYSYQAQALSWYGKKVNKF